jgi:predicted RNA binding protein YcfA (HicA-like mRNA interferase family)
MIAERTPLALLRNVSVGRIIRALKRDGFEYKGSQGAQRIYRSDDGRRVVIHYHHSKNTLPPWVIQHLFIGTRWTKADLKRLGLL